MAGDALFLGWGQVVRGREQLALEVFQETIAYYNKLQEDGEIESFDTVLLGPHGGDLGGFVRCTANKPLWTRFARARGSCAWWLEPAQSSTMLVSCPRTRARPWGSSWASSVRSPRDCRRRHSATTFPLIGR